MRSRVVQLLPALWLLGLLSLPGLLYVVGSRQPHPAGNPYAPLPTSLESTETWSKAETYPALEKVVLDRLPLRQHALELRAGIAMGLFSSSPVADARYGKDGWLYLKVETRSCDGTAPPSADFPQAVGVVADTLAATQRRAAVVISGTKMLEESEHRPWFHPVLLSCESELERAVRARLAQSSVGVDLEPAFERIRTRGVPLFLKQDTHWNGFAREQFVRAMLDRVRPGLADEANVRRGSAVERIADLAQMMEVRRTDLDQPVLMDAVADPPAPGSVVVIGDSQTQFGFGLPIGVAQPAFKPPLVGQTWCHVFEVPGGVCDAALPKADVVLVQASARHAKEFTDMCGRVVSLVGQKLRGRPMRYRDGDARAFRLADRPANIAVAGADDPTGSRLLRVPVTPTADAAGVTVVPTADGRPLPCATPAGVPATSALLIPIPAGVSLGDVSLAVSGAAGTMLGTPELVELGR